MLIKSLNKIHEVDKSSELQKVYVQFEKYLNELHYKWLPHNLIIAINKDIDDLNTFSGSENEWRKRLKETKIKIIKLLEKEIKFVPLNYYRNHWIAMGIASIGIPIGFAFALYIGNMAFVGAGLPIGAAIGLIIGSQMDKRAYNEGRQLNVNIN